MLVAAVMPTMAREGITPECAIHSVCSLDCKENLQKRLFGKQSASGRRQIPGSGGQVTDPAGAIHRLVLWVGDLSMAGVTCRYRAIRLTAQAGLD